MSDSTEAGTPAPEAPPEPAAVVLQKEVKERLSTTDAPDGEGSARERVVSSLVEEELERRAKVLSAALVKRKELAAGLKKIKPDQITRLADGTKQEAFSEAKFKEREKAGEKLGKLDKLINTVIGSPSADAYTKLEQFK